MGRELQEYTELNQHNTVEVPVLQRTTNEVPLGLSANWMEVLCRGSKMAYRVDALWNYGTDQSSAQDFVCYCSDRPYSWRALFLSIPLCLIPWNFSQVSTAVVSLHLIDQSERNVLSQVNLLILSIVSKFMDVYEKVQKKGSAAVKFHETAQRKRLSAVRLLLGRVYWNVAIVFIVIFFAQASRLSFTLWPSQYSKR